MRVKLYKEYGALNSGPVFAAVEQGLKHIGCQIVNEGQDLDVIWSVLWQGRMQANKRVYETAKSQCRPVMIIEVGNLFRGRTWRLSLDNINGLGNFANDTNLDPNRPKKLGIDLRPPATARKKDILVIGQHHHSLQWHKKQPMSDWVSQTLTEIRQHTDRPIVIRPHPRNPFSLNIPGIRVEYPQQVPGTYDDFNFDPFYHCVLNFNSGPAVKAAIEGVPVITDMSSLAYPVSDKLENIENPQLPSREDWFIRLCHTEWFIPELQQGIPQQRLIEYLARKS